MSFPRTVLALASAAVLLGASAPQRLVYPPTPARPVVDTYAGTAVTDPYRWLENASDPAVRAWASAQSDLARRVIHGSPAYAALRARVATLAQGSVSRSRLTVAGRHLVYLRRTPPAPQAVLVVRDGIDAPERVLFDPAASAAGAPPAIGSVFVSPDGSRVAFTTQLGGSEEETLHVLDVASGTMLADTLTHVGGGTTPTALAWDADGKGFTRTTLPRNADGTYARDGIVLVHHAIGSDPAADAYVFGRGLSPKAEYHLLASRDGSALAAVVADGDGVAASVYVRRGAAGAFEQVATPAAGIGSSSNAGSAFVGDVLAVVAKGRAPRGAVIGIGPGQTVETGKTLVPASGTVIEDVVPVAGGFATQEVDGGDSAMRVFAADGTPRATVPIPAISTVDELAADPSGGDVIVGVESYALPPRWYRYDAARNALVPTSVAQTAAGDFSQVRVTRALVPSLDGTATIPVEVVSGPNARGPRTPTILSAYGAYGSISRPRFSPALLAWIERGGAWSQAMIRGGGEYGEDWHQAARLATKTVSADDLAASAKWLGANGFGDAQHLGINGGSAGGFLMGLALTRNPGLYRAVVSSVGIYDLLRVELTPNGAFNTPEFGTVTDPAQFVWMRTQSPYHNVRAGVAYPAVLLTTGENDPRVEPYNSRKMAAALQASSSSTYPVLLLQKSGEGHGVGNSFQQIVDATAERFAFFWSQLSP
jgi:prolyl oligopeptidase